MSIAGAYRRYLGFLIFFVSVLLTIQFSWALDHERPKEIPYRALMATLLGLALGTIAVWAASRPRLSQKTQSVLQKLSHALWPSVVLLFLPFHKHQLCRVGKSCDYLDNFYLLEFVVVAVMVFTATLYPYPEKIAAFFKTRLSGLRPLQTIANHPYPFAFLLSLTILLATGWERYIHAEFFAEGGWVFLAQALSEGWSSLPHFVDGFSHILPRLIVLTGLETVSIENLAHFTVTACFIVAALINAVIVRNEYRWLIPSTTVRWGICIAMSLAPGYGEMLGNLPTMHYMLFVLIGLLLIKDPRSSITVTELIAIVLSVASTGLFITLAPLAAVRLLLRTRFLNKLIPAPAPAVNWSEWTALLLILIASFALAGDVFLDALNYGLKHADIPMDISILFTGISNALAIYYTLHPFGGNKTVFEILPHVSILLLLVPLLVVTVVLFIIRWREDRLATIFFGLWLAAVLGIPAMLFIARPDSFYVFFSIDKYTYWWYFAWWMRYNYLVAVPAIIFWFIILRPKNLFALQNKASVFALLILASLFYNAQFILPVKRYQEQDVWKYESAKLARSFATGCPKAFNVNVIPGTYFHYVNKNSTRTDCKQHKN